MYSFGIKYSPVQAFKVLKIRTFCTLVVLSALGQFSLSINSDRNYKTIYQRYIIDRKTAWILESKMEELDEDRLELLERRLADRLTERVRSELLKLYAAMGATAISVLGLVGWNILQNLESGIKENIKDNLEEEIKPTRIQINKQLAETEVLAKQANGIVEKVKKQLDAFQPQAENLDNNIKLMEELSVRVQELNTNLRPVQGSTERDLYPIASSVKSLQRQLIELAIQVDKLNTIVTVSVQKPGGESAQAAQQRKAAIQSVISATQKAEQSLAKKRERTTVFFQFAGGKREQAKALSEALKKADYIVPGEEREGGAAGKHQVRYFYTQDRVAAENLAQDATRALRNLGYSISQVPNIEAKPFVSYSGKKPSQGTVELWLEIPSR